VLVLMGGPDAERAVSLDSGACVAKALRSSRRFRVAEAVIDAPGAEELRRLADDAGARVVFPVLHGTWGEGGPLQEALEEAGLAYVGSRPRSARLAMDKLATKTTLRVDGVPTPIARALDERDACDVEPPLVLKPIDDGSSVDLRICRTPAEVEQARAVLHDRRGRLMAERYVAGRELTVGIVDDAALPVIEIIPAVEFYDYEAKYEREDTRYVVDPDLPAETLERCREIALLAFRRLGCRDLARVDFIDAPGGPWFLELNTMPGFTTHSLLPMAARATGVEMPALCAGLARTALDRGRQVPRSESAGGTDAAGAVVATTTGEPAGCGRSPRNPAARRAAQR
jgi:D-alanine-D-alanine ligase